MRFPLLTLAVLLTGCATAPSVPTPPLVAFNPDEAKWAQGTGTAIVEGQAFLKTRGGDVKYGAGNSVYLMPHTPHSFDWMVRVTGDLSTAPTIDPALEALVRKTTASGDGRFKFENLPAGPYLVVTTVTWEVPGAYSSSIQGGYVGTPVTATEGRTVSVIVTR